MDAQCDSSDPESESACISCLFRFPEFPLFYWLGRIDWRIRTLRIPAEAFNKRGRTVDVYIGEPVSPEEIQNIADDKDLAEFLYQRTYAAKNNKPV